MLKFNMYNITDTETGLKVKVRYMHTKDIHGKMRVWILEDGYSRKLFKLFDNAKNDSDGMTDYFEETRVIFYEGHPYYDEILKVLERYNASLEKRRESRKQKTAA
jgi:hypothetical protein